MLPGVAYFMHFHSRMDAFFAALLGLWGAVFLSFFFRQVNVQKSCGVDRPMRAFVGNFSSSSIHRRV
jgi:hypothetical protein